MSLKDRFDKFIDYFTEDGEETTNYQTQQEETVSPAISSSKELPAPAQSGSAKMQILLVFMRDSKNWQCKVTVQMRK